MSIEGRLFALKRRELEDLLRGYGLPQSVRAKVASSLQPEPLDRMLRKLRPWRLWGKP